MDKKLVQFRLPASLYRWVKEIADSRGQTVAGFALEQLLNSLRQSTTRAWVRPARRSDPSVVLAQGFQPTYLLLQLGETSDGGHRFGLLHASPDRVGVPVSEAVWRETTTFREYDDHLFLLEGSPHRWRFVSSTHDATRGLIVVTLRVESEGRHSSPEQWAAYLEQRTLGLLTAVNQSGADPVDPRVTADLENLLRLFESHRADAPLPPNIDPSAGGLPQPRPGATLSRLAAETLLARVLDAVRFLQHAS